jgi:hypothetical protein
MQDSGSDGVQHGTFSDAGPGEPVRLPWWVSAGMTSDPCRTDDYRPSWAETRAELATHKPVL